MRELKFRAWDKKDKHWHINVFIHIDGRVNSKELGLDFKTAEDFELMQYTGLLDRNGKEIYEGDITRQILETKANGKVKKWTYVEAVEWHQPTAMFVLANAKPDVDPKMLCAYYDQLEVIGNIWENGDLLK